MRYQLETTDCFDKWLKKVRDKKSRARIFFRFDALCSGNFGDHKQLAPELFELRFFFGGGIRIYYTIRNGSIVFLLAGGNKSSQKKDIVKAKDLIKELEE